MRSRPAPSSCGKRHATMEEGRRDAGPPLSRPQVSRNLFETRTSEPGPGSRDGRESAVRGRPGGKSPTLREANYGWLRCRVPDSMALRPTFRREYPMVTVDVTATSPSHAMTEA